MIGRHSQSSSTKIISQFNSKLYITPVFILFYLENQIEHNLYIH